MFRDIFNTRNSTLFRSQFSDFSETSLEMHVISENVIEDEVDFEEQHWNEDPLTGRLRSQYQIIENIQSEKPSFAGRGFVIVNKIVPAI